MDGRTRRNIKARPALEGLEGRQLLDAGAADAGLSVAAARNVVVRRRSVSYSLAGGARVNVSLVGPGSLKGSTVTGANLNIVYDNTTQDSAILGTVTGGRGRANLGSIRDADLPLFDQTGIGADPIAFVNLNRFDLVNDGTINLTGGVGAFLLGSSGANSQIMLKQGPVSPVLNPITRSILNIQSGSGTTLIAPTTVGTTTSGGSTISGGTQTTSTSTGGSSGTVVVTQTTSLSNEILVPATPSTVPDVPAGIDFRIGRILGTAGVVPRLQNPQVYATDFDGTQTRLLRIAVDPIKLTSTTLQTIPLGDLGTPDSEVGLAYYQGRQVVLVGAGNTVRVYSAIDPTQFVGQFSTSNLFGGAPILGVGGSTVATVLTFDTPQNPVTLTQGAAQTIDLAASLASGQAVSRGAPFFPQRGFQIVGGASGSAGSDAVFMVGAAHFDTAQGNNFNVGFLGAVVSNSTGGITEGGRAAIIRPVQPPQLLDTPSGGTQVLTAPSTNPEDFSQLTAVGSIEQTLAVVTSFNASAGTNTVGLYDFRAGAFANSLTIANPNRLRGLSQSFHPELQGAAIIDVQGNLRTFRASGDVTGMVMNVNGILNELRIQGPITDSTIVARPIVHVRTGPRQDVNLISTAREVAQRGDVITYPTTKLRPFGPLTTPTRVVR